MGRVTYQGAFRTVRRILDWKLWMRLMLAYLADPQNYAIRRFEDGFLDYQLYLVVDTEG